MRVLDWSHQFRAHGHDDVPQHDSEPTGRLQGFAPNYLDHPAVDLTGLKDAWDFTVGWTPKPAFDAAAKPDAAPDGSVTMFEAFDKQLAIKLELSKQPMPVLVIDKAEQKPSEN
jgi:uncharacterized protein (TIGR03435 family)